MKWLWLTAAALTAAGGLIWVIGLLLPTGHVASRAVVFRRPPNVVWEAITDYAGSLSWRTDLQRVERVQDRNGHPVWREVRQGGDALTLETVEALPSRRLVRQIADPDLPFGGSWTYEITASDGGSRLTITERGEVYNPMFRFASRFVFGHHATIDAYLGALGRKFQEDVIPETPPR